MFSTIRKFIGAIKVREDRGMVYIEGLPSKDITNEIMRIWSTSRISNFMFTKVTNSSISFNSFFAPDFLYTLETIYNGKNGKWKFRILGRIIELLYEETWLRDLLEEQDDILNFSKVSELNITLLPHQDEFLSIFNEKVPRYHLRGYILGAAPGSGKTLTNLALGCCLESEVVICIVPKNSVDSVWVDTIATRFVKPQKYWASTMKTDPEKGCRFYVFHYEQLERAIEFFKKQKFHNPLIVLDESHNLNEIGSARTQNLIKLANNLEAFVVWASGTPLKALGKEVMPILSTIAPDFNDDAKERFNGIFGKNATKAIDILRNRIGYMTFVVDKKVVVGNQVTTVEKKVQIPTGEKYTLDNIREDMRKFIQERMTYYQTHMADYVKTYEIALRMHADNLSKSGEVNFRKYKDYIKIIRQGYDSRTMGPMVQFCNQYELKEIMPGLPKDLRDAFKGARSVVKYYELKVQGEALGRILGRQRSQCHVDMVPYCDLPDLIDEGLSKTVIFTSYVEVVDSIAKHLEEKGYSPLRVYGDTNKDLTSIIKTFKDDIDANPLIATFQSLSTAVPLVMANQAILMNSPFRVHEYQQATARVDRLGQIHPVRIINIFLDTGAKPNISTRSGDIMDWSREQVEAMMGTKIDLDLSMECFVELVTDMKAPEAIYNTRPSFMGW